MLANDGASYQSRDYAHVELVVDVVLKSLADVSHLLEVATD